MQYYKNKYMIALYRGGKYNDEYFVDLFDNAQAMAKGLGIKLGSAQSALSRAYTGERRYVIYNGRRHTICFIDMTEGEDNND